jgi:hemerythrin-like domain-containing protein
MRFFPATPLEVIVSKAIADLMNEHDTIQSAIQLLERMMVALENAPSVDAQDLHQFLAFLKEFVDKCHHGKEEVFLFPAMIEAGIRDHGGPVGVLLSEHARGRQLIRDMQAAIEPALDRARLAQAAREYGSLLKNHIHKENRVMFPMAERSLAAAQLEKVFAGFAELEEKAIGPGRLEELHGMLKKLQEKYPLG